MAYLRGVRPDSSNTAYSAQPTYTCNVREKPRNGTGSSLLTRVGLHKVPHFYSGNGRANFDDLTDSGCAHDLANLDRRKVRPGGIEPSTHGRIERDIVDSDNDLVLLQFGDEVAGCNLDGLECCGYNCSSRPLVKDDLLNSIRDRRHACKFSGGVEVECLSTHER